jgi:predicted RNA-binding Zn-ribbon protein involved in translation (DUF1610 family)
MHRRTFLRSVTAITAAAAAGLTSFTIAGCGAPRVSPKARDQSAGEPWQCQHCGHLTRSQEDLSDDRCPRCYRRQLRRISEEEMAQALAAAKSQE